MYDKKGMMITSINNVDQNIFTQLIVHKVCLYYNLEK